VGRIVNRFLTEYFSRYVDYDFTARLEDELDAISRGEKDWLPLMQGFWSPFKELIDHTEKNVQRKDVTQEPIDENCPKCGKQLSIRLGRRGRFIGCSGFPDCDYTRSLDGDETSGEPEVVEGRKCPECESDLVIRTGRYGKFIGCSSYPDCRYIEPLEKPADTGVECPECHQGKMLTRRSRSGKTFYSCSRYPDCKYAVWNEPLNEPCPNCNWPMLTLKTTKRRGTEKVCPQKECGFVEKVETEDAEEEVSD
jgi:DNA topoisomerase-1